MAEVTDSWWHSMLILPPLFKESPASPFLAAYYPDCVGMSPSGSPSNVSLTELRADHCRAVQPQSESVYREIWDYVGIMHQGNFCSTSPVEISV